MFCSASGMLSMGNTIPEKYTVGTMVSSERSIAASWLLTQVEMSSPRARATRIYNNERAMKPGSEPAIGTPRTNTARSSIVTRLAMEITK